MGDVNKIFAVVVFWVLLFFSLFYISQDVSFGNYANFDNLTVNQTAIHNFSGSTDETNILNVPFTFLDVFLGMFTFRVPNVNSSFFSFAIGLINYILVTMFILLVYRQIRSGSG